MNSRLLNAASELRTTYRIGSNYLLEGVGPKPADVRFGSKADICIAVDHVRFTPDSDIDCVFRHVCFGPKADIN
jgi:hypothetical protein